jgi:phage FluMu protein Com
MPDTEIRCNCGKTLFFKKDQTIEIKCQGCKRIQRLSLTELAEVIAEVLKIK